MEINLEKSDRLWLATLHGKLDAHGTQIAQRELNPPLEVRNVILDLAGVPYLSSAGLRLFLILHKQCRAGEGRLILVGLQPYCQEVLRISGLATAFDQAETVADARRQLEPVEAGQSLTLEVTPGSPEPGAIEVMGHIEDVLASRITPELVHSKTFFATEYSLGLGAMAPSVEDALPVMGEMMTIGGTMVWLPTDGNDTPDYLVPHADSDLVTIRTGFNAALAGPFNDYFHVRSAPGEAITMSGLYRALFDFAKANRPQFRGALGIAMRADVEAVYGCGVIYSPIAGNAPANGKWITDPSNFKDWFEFDEAPRNRNVTGLISGVGLDHSVDLSGYDSRYLEATFYINPANQGSQAMEQLHNHGVFFTHLPFPDPPRSLETEIAAVVEAGDFVNMRHLLDSTRITRAWIGVIYVQEFRADSKVSMP